MSNVHGLSVLSYRIVFMKDGKLQSEEPVGPVRHAILAL